MVFYSSLILFEKLGTDLGQKSAFFKKSDYVIKNDVMTYFENFFNIFRKVLVKSITSQNLNVIPLIFQKLLQI